MKKLSFPLIVVLLFSCLLFCFNACGNDNSEQKTLNGRTTRQTYSQIVSTINRAKDNLSYVIDYSVNEFVASKDQTLASERKFTTTVNKNNDNFIYSTLLDIRSLGSNGTSLTLEKTFTFFDNVLYRFNDSKLNGNSIINKTKESSTYGFSLVAIGESDKQLSNPLYDFSEYDFENISFVNQDSIIFFEFTIKGEEAKTFAREILLSTNVSFSTYSCDEVSYKFVVDSYGNFEKAMIKFTANVSLNQTNYEYACQGEITFSSVGSTTVSIPQDAENYLG